MIKHYSSLSRDERRAAKKLAKKLLRVPALKLKNAPHPTGLRTEIATAFWKPKNLIGVLVYGDDKAGWSGDVVFRRGKGIFQVGATLKSYPKQSEKDAIRSVKHHIALLKKCAREHPNVRRIRKSGIDPEQMQNEEYYSFGKDSEALSASRAFAKVKARFVTLENLSDDFPFFAFLLEGKTGKLS